MKKALLIAAIILAGGIASAQTPFPDMAAVIKFMEDKTYYNADMDIELEFGMISSYNTYGITLKSKKSGNTMYFINCDIKTYGSFADISGMSPTDGSNFKFRLYKTKIVVGAGEQKQSSFYLKEE